MLAADQLKLLYDLHKLGVTYNALSPEKVLTSNNIADPRLYLIGISDARKINKYNKLLDPAHTNERPVKVGKFSALAIHLGACSLSLTQTRPAKTTSRASGTCWSTSSRTGSSGTTSKTS